MGELSFGGPTGVIVLLAYAVIMLLIGYVAGRGRHGEQKGLRGYYLAGGNLSAFVLFFTLYATQYSGNTVVGYAPEAYREGFAWWQSVTFFTAVIAGYLLYAPRLYVLAKRHSFVTPNDWIQHRFQSSTVVTLATLLMIWGLASYLLEQLIAMGHAIAGLTGETVPYQIGVAAFVCVMLVYSWTGGMRAVALTDVMQGIALLVGILVLLVGAFLLTGGSWTETTRHLVERAPEAVAVPSLEDSVNWLSMIVLVALGISLYPHAIQRIYAARSERTLRRSLMRMVWMPLITAGTVFCIGLLGIQLFPNLSDDQSERLLGILANEVAGMHPVAYLAMVLLMGGVVAAIISTADSALLSLASIVSKDLYGRFTRRAISEHRQVLVGKVVGVVVVFVLLLIAWNPPGTLVNIFVLKMELIVQLVPAFILGLYWQRLSAGPVAGGMVVGTVVAATLTITGNSTVFGVHGGLVGLLANLVVCVLGSLLVGNRTDTRGHRPPDDELATTP